MDKNFLLSPISMALLRRGTASFTASSMGTGGMFSPPAVMISSVSRQEESVELEKLQDMQNRETYGCISKQNALVGITFNSPCNVEESVLVAFAQVTRVQPAFCIQSLLRLVRCIEVTHEDVATPEADLAVPLLVRVVQLCCATWDLLTTATEQTKHWHKDVSVIAFRPRRKSQHLRGENGTKSGTW